MTPAFVAGLERENEILSKTDDPLVRFYLCQLPISDALDEIKWESTGLPLIHISDDRGEYDRTPRQQANRLLSFAFDDTAKIIKYASNFMEQKGYSPRDYGRLLLAGKKSLLLPALLDEEDKQMLFTPLEYPETRDAFTNVVLFDEEFSIAGSGEDEHVVWSKDVQNWITSRTGREHGCPAHSIVVNTREQGKQRLFNLFWDTVVSVAYTDIHDR
jgi:hypothetical protein